MNSKTEERLKKLFADGAECDRIMDELLSGLPMGKKTQIDEIYREAISVAEEIGQLKAAVKQEAAQEKEEQDTDATN